LASFAFEGSNFSQKEKEANTETLNHVRSTARPSKETGTHRRPYSSQPSPQSISTAPLMGFVA